MTTDDSKVNNNNNNSCSMPEEDQKRIWKEYLQRNSSSQCELFLNLYWSQIEPEKADIVAIYHQYTDREERVPTMAFSPFNLVLENLQKQNLNRVRTAMDTYGDRSSMAKRFLELGFKMNNSKISLLEGLMFIYGYDVQETVVSAPTPCTAVVRAANVSLKGVRDGHQAKADAIAKLKADIESGAISKMKAMGVRGQITNMENEYAANGINMKREVKAAQRVVTSAEKDLVAENTKGTDASNYFKAQASK